MAFTKRPRAKNMPGRRDFLAGTGAVAAGLTFGPRFAWAAEEKKLNFYNWDTYIGEDTLETSMPLASLKSSRVVSPI